MATWIAIVLQYFETKCLSVFDGDFVCWYETYEDDRRMDRPMPIHNAMHIGIEIIFVDIPVDTTICRTSGSVRTIGMATMSINEFILW